MPQGPERPIVNLRMALEQYQIWHSRTYGSRIGDDGILGPAWADMVRSFRTLLNGQTGRLDCGTLDSWAVDALKVEGFDE